MLATLSKSEHFPLHFGELFTIPSNSPTFNFLPTSRGDFPLFVGVNIFGNTMGVERSGDELLCFGVVVVVVVLILPAEL